MRRGPGEVCGSCTTSTALDDATVLADAQRVHGLDVAASHACLATQAAAAGVAWTWPRRWRYADLSHQRREVVGAACPGVGVLPHGAVTALPVADRELNLGFVPIFAALEYSSPLSPQAAT